MSQIGDMVAAFAQRRTDAVAGAVGSLRQQLQDGGAATGAHLQELRRGTAAAVECLQVRASLLRCSL